MKHPTKVGKWVIAGVAVTAVTAPITARAIDLGGIITGGAIAVAVTQFGGQINDFVNKLTGNKDDNADRVTKVVPIISAGTGTYLGAVQVAGPRTDVDTVKAVAQLEGKLSRFRVKALIPVDTINPTKSPSRVRNVGVTALVDVKL
jgi:hypothetical protein